MSGFEVLGSEYLIEEETFSWYNPDEFYPVQNGEIFQSKYQVLGKLGFGSVSTAWLYRDLVYVIFPLTSFEICHWPHLEIMSMLL